MHKSGVCTLFGVCSGQHKNKGILVMKIATTLTVTFSIIALAGCVTTKDATAEERASCERMEQAMGTDATHDHNEMKGRGMNPMNLSHARCRQILAQ